MNTFQQRVIDEKTELDDRLSKLIEFFDSTLFSGLPINEQQRLRRQRRVMAEYSTILADRIRNFT